MCAQFLIVTEDINSNFNKSHVQAIKDNHVFLLVCKFIFYEVLIPCWSTALSYQSALCYDLDYFNTITAVIMSHRYKHGMCLYD